MGVSGVVMVKNSSGTDTSVGFISHLWYRELRCPVKLETYIDSNGSTQLCEHPNTPQRPKRDRYGNYIYALPNGGEITMSEARRGIH